MNPVQIKPRTGTVTDAHLLRDICGTLRRLISTEPALGQAIAATVAGKATRQFELEVDRDCYSIDLVHLDSDTDSEAKAIVLFSQNPKAKSQSSSGKENAQAEFFAELTHEIRTSVNIILGNTRHAKNASNTELVDLISNTTRASEQLLSLTNEYLNLVKTKEKSPKAITERKNLFQFIEASVQPFQPLAKSKNLRLETRIDSALNEIVEFPPVSVTQVINNLLYNAIVHTNKGMVSLSASVKEKGTDEMRIAIKVIDTGVGIAKEDQSVVFDKFVQLQPNCKEGTGLGLSIVRKIVNELGGKISVASSPGMGSEFGFEFTVKRGVEEVLTDSQPVQSELEGILSGIGKILVIDDNPINLYIVQRQLGHLHLEADVAENALDALKLMCSNRYSLALVDVSMPQIDGLMLASITKHIHPNLKIAMFTAGDLEDKIDQLLELGITSVLSKPYTMEDLRGVLMRELGESKVSNPVYSRTDIRNLR